MFHLLVAFVDDVGAVSLLLLQSEFVMVKGGDCASRRLNNRLYFGNGGQTVNSTDAGQT